MENEKKKRILWRTIIFVSIIAISLPLFIFYWNFRFLTISANPYDWGTFGSYIGGIYTFINVLAILLLTYIASSINKNIADSQIKQNIYNAYFEQINFLFFDVIRSYREYENNKSDETSLKLNNSIEMYKIYIENLNKETESLTKIYSIEEIINSNINSCENFMSKFRTLPEEERDKLLVDFIKNKTILINNINKTIKVR